MPTSPDSNINKRQQTLPAWPLGVVVAIVNLLFGCNAFGMIAIQMTAFGSSTLMAQLLPLLFVALLPLAELVAGLRMRKGTHHYAAQALLYGVLFTFLIGGALTLLFNIVDYFALRSL